MIYKNENVVTGKNCRIAPDTDLVNITCGDNVVINSGTSMRNVVIGNDSIIKRNIVLYSPYDDKPVIIGKNVLVGHGVFGEATGGRIIIGDDAGIAHFVVFVTSTGPGEERVLLDEIFPGEVGDIIIGKSCWVGMRSMFLPGIDLPEGTVIAANSVVRKQEYKSWCLYAGSPAVFKKALK